MNEPLWQVLLLVHMSSNAFIEDMYPTYGVLPKLPEPRLPKGSLAYRKEETRAGDKCTTHGGRLVLDPLGNQVIEAVSVWGTVVLPCTSPRKCQWYLCK